MYICKTCERQYDEKSSDGTCPYCGNSLAYSYDGKYDEEEDIRTSNYQKSRKFDIDKFENLFKERTYRRNNGGLSTIVKALIVILELITIVLIIVFSFKSCNALYDSKVENNTKRKVDSQIDYEEDDEFKLNRNDNVFQHKDHAGELDTDAVTFYPDEETANDGTVFSNLIEYSPDEFHSSLKPEYTYLLNGNYDVVTGTVFIDAKNKNAVSGNKLYFEAYGDGKLLFTSPKMDSGVLPQKISFNVNGIQELKIVYNIYESEGSTEDRLYVMYISNFVAKKE